MLLSKDEFCIWEQNMYLFGAKVDHLIESAPLNRLNHLEGLLSL